MNNQKKNFCSKYFLIKLFPKALYLLNLCPNFVGSLQNLGVKYRRSIWLELISDRFVLWVEYTTRNFNLKGILLKGRSVCVDWREGHILMRWKPFKSQGAIKKYVSVQLQNSFIIKYLEWNSKISSDKIVVKTKGFYKGLTQVSLPDS